jgi:cytoskeletal protein RodZ
MASEALKKFSEELKAERESKNISLQQIANKTKIDIKFLRAIEEAKFDIQPEIYVRAFIKEYASVLDLKVNEVMSKFDFAMHGKVEEKQEEKPVAEEKKEIHEKPVVPESIIKEQPQTSSAPENKKKKFDYSYLVGAAAAFAILIILYYFFIKESSPEIVTEKNYNSSVEEEKPAFEIDSVQTEKKDTTSAIANDSLKLSVSVSKRMWVKVLSDNRIRQIGMADENSVFNFNAYKEFRVVVGNAGYAKLSFNGKPVQNVGKPGELRNIIINADTVRAYTLPPPVKNENKSPTKN